VPLLVAGAIGLVWLALAAPLLVPTVRELRDTAASRPPVLGAEYFSADVLSFVLPAPVQTWWGGAAGRAGFQPSAPPNERGVFLGYLPLLLAAAGLWRDRRRAAFWGVAALVFAVLALGPTLQVNGQPTVAAIQAGVGLPLPYRLLEQIPAANVARVPARFALLVTLCLAVLAGCALAPLVERVRGSARPWVRTTLAVALAAALLAEQLAVPYQLTPVTVPAFYQQLAQDAGDGAVLELPLVVDRPPSLLYQTVHGHPIIGGYLSRPLAYPLLDLPPFRELAGRQAPPDIVPPDAPDLAGAALALANVRWIVILRDLPRANLPNPAAFVARYAEPAPVYEDAHLAVYRSRTLTGDPAPALAVRPAEGWYEPEPLAGSAGRMRWFRQAAALNVWNFTTTPQTTALRFDAWSFHGARRLAVSLDGHNLGQWQVDGVQRFDLPLTLPPGLHRIELRSLDPPTRPVDAGVGGDPRPLAIGVANVAAGP
jgi:hypothetical protein